MPSQLRRRRAPTGVICRLFLLVMGLSAAFGVAELRAAVHEYEVGISADLSTVSVTARLDGTDLRLRAPAGRIEQLEAVQGCDGATSSLQGRTLRVRGGCARYVTTLVPVRSDRSYARRSPRFAGHESWLWLPPLAEDDVVKLTLRLPEGVDAVVPWRRTGVGRFELRRSPGSGEAIAWFGSLQKHTLTLQDIRLPVVLIDAANGARLNPFVIKPWLEEAAGLVASVGGTFPNRFAQVVVEPGEVSLFGDSPVPFGHVIRSGEEVVRFFVQPTATGKALREDWTAVHEFAHLLLPYVRDDQKWISEGFASYYQNVLLARGGIYSEVEAWQRLARSFRSASEGHRPPSPNDAHTRSFWEVRMLIYWSGAALALMGDVELRRVSEGRVSLDTVLGRLAACCLPSPRIWEGRELFAKLDLLSGHAVFVPLYDRYANTAGMPDTTALLQAMGIRMNRKDVVLDGTAPLAAERSAIMRRMAKREMEEREREMERRAR
jgi:hypothetical protein